MEKYTMFIDRKNQYSENEYTTQRINIVKMSILPKAIQVSILPKMSLQTEDSLSIKV